MLPTTNSDIFGRIKKFHKQKLLRLQLIFLRRSGTVGQPVDILFAPHLTDILNSLKNKMSSKLLSNDIEKYFKII